MDKYGVNKIGFLNKLFEFLKNLQVLNIFLLKSLVNEGYF